ncbi:hypothetical protein GWK47_022698 [Chionoecetes opilio]|uniref:Uncharacterized protein n=1 Tax=Chionoecetes opilio TaxID=41210 RepID=A0A8J4XQB5_CHIOP|nr:hypothetical protein GWK47_022698 [Chionoecetes opilio]
MMTNQGETKKFLLAQGESQDVEEGGRRRFRPCCSGDEAISSLGKGRCFLRPQTRRGCRFLSVAQLESSPSSSSNTSAVVSDEEYGAVWRSEPFAKRATKNIVSPPTGGHAGSNQADRSFRDIRAGLKPHVAWAQRNVEELNINRHPSDAKGLKHRAAMASRSERSFGQELRWWSTGMASS